MVGLLLRKISYDGEKVGVTVRAEAFLRTREMDEQGKEEAITPIVKFFLLNTSKVPLRYVDPVILI